MTTNTAAPSRLAPDGSGSRMAGRLLVAGATAGPVFTTVVAAQALTRDGFDLSRQPLSLLSLGDLGWVQIANFVVCGLLVVGLAAGMRPALTPGAGSTWGPALAAVFGVGLVAGGVFVPDPALGYPPGTPDAIPAEFSWHGILHAAAPPLAFTALVACCLVLARRFAADREKAWTAYSCATAVTALGLSGWPSQDGASVRLAVAVLVGFVWTTALALRLRRRLA